MRPIHVGVGHDDHAVVAQLGNVELFLADAAAQSRDQCRHLFAREQPLEAGLFDVEDFALQRQDRLEAPIAPLLGRAARGIALHQVKLAQLGILFLAVGQFSGQTQAVGDALAPREVARLARRLAGARRLHDLVANDLGLVGVFLKVNAQRLGQNVRHQGLNVAGHQLVLGLRGKRGGGQLDAQHAGQALAHVIARDLDLGLFGDVALVAVGVDRAGHRRPKRREMRAAVALGDVVGEALRHLGEGVGPLRRQLHRHALARALAIEDFFMQRLAVAVEVLHEGFQAARGGEGVAAPVAPVEQLNVDRAVEEGQLAQALAQRLVVVIDRAENLAIGQKAHQCAAFA